MKYLNPSTVFVATGPPQALLTEDLNPGSTLLTVQILDTVTGAPIHRQVHKVNHQQCLDLDAVAAPLALRYTHR